MIKAHDSFEIVSVKREDKKQNDPSGIISIHCAHVMNYYCLLDICNVVGTN